MQNGESTDGVSVPHFLTHRLGFAQLAGFLFGHGVIEKCSRAALDSGDVFQFGASALNGVKVDVEMKVRVIPLHRALAQQHHQRHGKPVQIVVFHTHLLDDGRQIRRFDIGRFGDTGEVAARADLYLAWPARKERNERYEILVLGDDPVAGRQLVTENAAVDAFVMVAQVVGCSAQLAL